MAADSPASFTTAREGDTTFLTPPSDPSVSQSPSVAASSGSSPAYRPAAQLPYELANHCSVYLESGQYLQGFTLLTSLLRSGTTSAPSNPFPAQIPPTQIFELSATLVVHPAVTTRASTPDKVEAANAAIAYLRNINRIIGPVAANFAQAFSFQAPGSSRNRHVRRRGGLDVVGKVEDERPIKSIMANDGAVWAQAEDFWYVLGWAFNCSAKHKSRWARWKLWLELMIEIMEDDWKQRCKLQDETWGKDGYASEDIVLQSIIAQYLLNAHASSLPRRRRILRAILADGGAKAMGEFREVFKNELRERKKEEDVKPIKEMKPDEGDFGDLIDLDEDEGLDSLDADRKPAIPIRRSSRNANTRPPSVVSLDTDSEEETNEDSVSPTERLGGIESVQLRQRFLAFLSVVAERIPDHFISREQLFDTYTEHLRPLPAPIFALLIHTSLLPAPAQCILAANTLLPLLPHSPPVYNFTPPTQDEWTVHFLPFHANTHGFADNAKVSLLLQQVLQLMLPDLKWDKAWVEAVLRGMRARRKKARGLNKSGGGGLRSDEIVASKVLKGSEQLLLLLVGWVEDDASVPQSQRPDREDLVDNELARNRSRSTSALSSVPSDLDSDSSDLEVLEDVRLR